jgi:hypothetical protein
MKKLIVITFVIALTAVAAPVLAQWTPLPADPSLWPYADGPTVETVVLPHSVYRMGSAVGMYEGEMAIFSGGGRAGATYSLGAPDTDPRYWDNRQSHFSIYRTSVGWISADGTDDTDNGDGTWTSVGLTGYNNANGTNSPLVGQGTGYTMDQSFYYDGAFYIFGGYPQWGGNMAKYDIATNSWSQVQYGNNDNLYMDGGGLIGSHFYKVRNAGNLMDYDAATDTFGADIAIAGLIDPQYGSCSGVIGDKLLIVDTSAAATPGALYEIDPGTATVTTKASALIPVREAASVVHDGRLYVLGGRMEGGNDTAISRIQCYVPELDAWFFSAVDLPDARSGFLAEIMDETLYIGNGFNNLTEENAGVLDDFYSIGMADVSQLIPEPSTIMMIGSGLIGLLALLKRKK